MPANDRTMLPLKFARAWWIASALLILALIVGSLGTGPHLPLPGRFDKLQHFGAYCFLAVWFGGLFARPHFWRIALALGALGLAIEVLQAGMHRGREGDPLDMVANALGIACGFAVAIWLTAGWAPKIEAWLARR